MSETEKSDLKRDNRIMTFLLGVAMTVTSTVIVNVVTTEFKEVRSDINTLKTLPARVDSLDKKINDHILVDEEARAIVQSKKFR